MNHYATYIFSHPQRVNNKIIFTDKIEVVVDNIPCDLDFTICKGHWVFNLNDRDIFTDENFRDFEPYYNKCHDKKVWKDFDKNVDITLEIIETFIKIMLDTLDNLKFSKLKGKFVSKEQCRKLICQKMAFGKFMQNENVDEENKCSVCFDSTETRTHCGHTVCFPCWQKIKN